jgi:hypothetical protein
MLAHATKYAKMNLPLRRTRLVDRQRSRLVSAASEACYEAARCGGAAGCFGEHVSPAP